MKKKSCRHFFSWRPFFLGSGCCIVQGCRNVENLDGTSLWSGLNTTFLDFTWFQSNIFPPFPHVPIPQWFKLRKMQRKLFGTLDRLKLWLFECFQWILALKGSKNWIKAKEGQKGQWRPTKAIKGQNFKTILFHH